MAFGHYRPSTMARALLSGVLLLAAACTAPGASRGPALTQSELLAAMPDAPPPISSEQAFGLDEEMRAFVAARVAGFNDPGTRVRALLRGMDEHGLFSLEYTDAGTRTARETFHDRQANCLSATMLLVGLGREAGLDVRYQTVDVPPRWSSEAGIVVVSSHINAIVKSRSQNYIVDFNLIDFRGNYETREVDDSYALALFYNNLGVEALLREEYDLSMQYLRAAIEAHPGVSHPWANLGLLYARLGQHDFSDAAYLHALEADPSDRTALTNLMHLHASLGNDELAAVYRDRIGRNQQRNPYSHFALAQAAYDEKRLDDALAALGRAIRIKHDEHQFYFLQGRVRLDLGQTERAEGSFARAKRYAAPEVRAVYEATIEEVAGRQAPL